MKVHIIYSFFIREQSIEDCKGELENSISISLKDFEIFDVNKIGIPLFFLILCITLCNSFEEKGTSV